LSATDLPYRPHLAWGIACGIAAAVTYTVANMCLRSVSQLDPVLVSAARGLPSIAWFLPVVLWRWWNSQPLWASRGQLLTLVVAGAAAQLLGNVTFQYSLGVVGMAVAVPQVLGMMIISGAVIGYLVLGERISWQTGFGIACLLLALGCFALGGSSAQSVVDIRSGTDVGDAAVNRLASLRLVLALAGNLAGGFAYAVMGSIMRRTMQRGMPVESMLLLLSTVGCTLLGSWAATRISLEQLWAIDQSDWWRMLLAGCFNTLAFYTLAISLRHIPLVMVHMLNASQATLAAMAGWLFFGEPLTSYLVTGLMLTIFGLSVAGYRGRNGTRRSLRSDAISPAPEPGVAAAGANPRATAAALEQPLSEPATLQR
jgi:drug/metabolite transporter, DME family